MTRLLRHSLVADAEAVRCPPARIVGPGVVINTPHGDLSMSVPGAGAGGMVPDETHGNLSGD